MPKPILDYRDDDSPLWPARCRGYLEGKRASDCLANVELARLRRGPCDICRNWYREVDRLRAENEELRGSVKSKQNCLDAALEGWNKANARIERLRLTLRPFARVGEAIAEWEPDDKDLWLGIVHCIPDSARILPVAWFRNAAATLKDEP